MAIKVGGTTVVDDSRNICSVITVNATTVCATTLKGEGANITGISGTVPVGAMLLSTSQPCNYLKADGTIYSKTSQSCLYSVIGDRLDLVSATIAPKRPVNIMGYEPIEMCDWGTSVCLAEYNNTVAHYNKWNCCCQAAAYLCTCDNIPYNINLFYKCGNACSVYAMTCNTTFNSPYSLGSGNYRMVCKPGYGSSPYCNQIFVYGNRDNGSGALFADFGIWYSADNCLRIQIQCCRCDNFGTYERNNALSHLRGGYLQSKPNNPFWIYLNCNCGQTTTPCRFWMAIASNTNLAYSGVTLGLSECVVGDISSGSSDNYSVANVLCNLVSFGYDTLLLGGGCCCQMIVKFYSGNTTPCYCCTVATQTCQFTTHGYNGNSCVFVGLRCNNLIYSPDGITWTTACCCTCLSFTGFGFLTTKDNKTILYGDFNRPHGTAGNVNILYSCNGCNWQLLTKCIGRSRSAGPMYEIPNSNIIANHNILVDNNFTCINLVYPFEDNNICKDPSYCGAGRCTAYVYGLQCYISLPRSTRTCNGCRMSIYGSANGDGWCFIGELPDSSNGDSFILQQYTCKILGAAHSFNSNVTLFCANLGTTPLSFTCVDTRIRPCSQFLNNAGPIQIFSNKVGTSVGFAIACSCCCCGQYAPAPSFNNLSNALIQYTKNFGTTICCITAVHNNCRNNCSMLIYENNFVPNLYNYGNVVSLYRQVCAGGGEQPVTFYQVRDAIHYCFNSNDDLIFAGCNCGCINCGPSGVCCTSLSLPLLSTNGTLYFVQSVIAPSTSGFKNVRMHYDECNDLHYTFAVSGCCTVLASTKNGTWNFNAVTIGCLSATGTLTTNAPFCCFPGLSHYSLPGSVCSPRVPLFYENGSRSEASFSMDCLNRLVTNYGAMCACFDNSLCFVLPTIDLSPSATTFIRAC